MSFLGKIQGTYFKISALYFKIYGLYFLQQAMCDFAGAFCEEFYGNIRAEIPFFCAQKQSPLCRIGT